MQAEIFNRNETQQRRHAIVERIRHKSPDGQGSGLVIIPTAPEPHHGHSATRYRPDSYFLYFCGLREHTAFLVLDVRAQSHETLLFLRDKDPDMELWDGKRLGIDAAPKTLGIDAAYPLAQLETVLAERMTYHQNLYHTWNISTTLDNLLTQQMQKQRNLVRRGIQPIKAVYDFRIHADQLRVIKSDWEITQMRHTCQVSAEVMTEAMARVRAGVGEHEIMGFFGGVNTIGGDYQRLHTIPLLAVMPMHVYYITSIIMLFYPTRHSRSSMLAVSIMVTALTLLVLFQLLNVLPKPNVQSTKSSIKHNKPPLKNCVKGKALIATIKLPFG